MYGTHTVFPTLIGSFHFPPVDYQHGRCELNCKAIAQPMQPQQPAAVRPLVPVLSMSIDKQSLIPGNSSQQQFNQLCLFHHCPLANSHQFLDNGITRLTSVTIDVEDHQVVIKVFSPGRLNTKREQKRFILHLGCLISYSSRLLKEDTLEQLGKEVICFDLQFDVGYMKGAQKICFSM